MSRRFLLCPLFLVLAASGVAGTVGCGSETVEAPPPAPVVEEAPAPQLPTGTPKPPTTEQVCATGVYAAIREPSNVLFLYDRSGSMHIKLPSGDTRWTATKNGFFNLLGALPATTSAGLMLFPQGDAPVNASCGIDPGVNDVVCKSGFVEPSQTARCAVPTYKTDVANGALAAAQVTALKNAVTASDGGFYWGTPLATSLRAAIQAQRASTVAGAKSVILLTDGNPTSCDQAAISNDIKNVIDAAATGLTGGALVRTFVIGLVDGARQAAKAENLSPVAEAGGTGRYAGCNSKSECFYRLTDTNFSADLQKVFDEISLQAFDCTFNLPKTKGDVDPSTVNVEITDASGTRTIPRDASHGQGWDYLPNGEQIQLYGKACTDMKDAKAKLNIVLGCETVEEPSTPK